MEEGNPGKGQTTDEWPTLLVEGNNHPSLGLFNKGEGRAATYRTTSKSIGIRVMVIEIMLKPSLTQTTARGQRSGRG